MQMERKNVALAGKNLHARVIHISTDYVFDGAKNTPYNETDLPRPLSVYGRSKRAGEEAVQEINGNYTIIRISRLYGQHKSNFVTKILHLGLEKHVVSVVTDNLEALPMPQILSMLSGMFFRLIFMAFITLRMMAFVLGMSGQGKSLDCQIYRYLSNPLRQKTLNAQPRYLKTPH